MRSAAGQNNRSHLCAFKLDEGDKAALDTVLTEDGCFLQCSKPLLEKEVRSLPKRYLFTQLKPLEMPSRNCETSKSLGKTRVRSVSLKFDGALGGGGGDRDDPRGGPEGARRRSRRFARLVRSLVVFSRPANP